MQMDVVSFAVFLNVFYVSVTMDLNMCGPGICCTGYFLKANICTECYPGTFGNNCMEECDKGHYGKKCQEKCPTDCYGNCNKSTGMCLESNLNQPPGVMNDTTSQSDPHKNITHISIEEEIEKFLKDKLWIIAGASSVLVIISCSCIGVFLLCKVCKGRQKRRGKLDDTTPSNQNQLASFSERYESDRNMHNNSSSPILPPRAQNSGGSKSSTNKSKPDTSNVEYSKPKPKKRYSLVQKVKVSQELTYPDVSEEEDAFDSDEFDDYTNTTGGVEISGIPKKQSFNTFQSSGDNKQTKNATSTAYGHVW